jgi:hypothetical protein
MKPATALLVIITAVFGAFSSYVMLTFGYLGIWRNAFTNAATMQVLFDLVITCLLLSGWMVIDARRSGRNAWPYVVITLAAGSFGPLLYLLVGRFSGAPSPSYA